jgi:hypothetical protein
VEFGGENPVGGPGIKLKLFYNYMHAVIILGER